MFQGLSWFCSSIEEVVSVLSSSVVDCAVPGSSIERFSVLSVPKTLISYNRESFLSKLCSVELKSPFGTSKLRIVSHCQVSAERRSVPEMANSKWTDSSGGRASSAKLEVCQRSFSLKGSPISSPAFILPTTTIQVHIVGSNSEKPTRGSRVNNSDCEGTLGQKQLVGAISCTDHCLIPLFLRCVSTLQV